MVRRKEAGRGSDGKATHRVPAWACRWPQAPPSQGLDLCLHVAAGGSGLDPQGPN